MKKRIMFVDHDPGGTGSTVSLDYLIRCFKDRGYDVFVLTSKNKKFAKSLLSGGIKIIPICQPSFFPISLYIHFANERSLLSFSGILTLLHDLIAFFWGGIIVSKAIMKLKPNIVYVNEYVFLQGSIAARLWRVPSVIHIRSLLLRGKWGIRQKLISRLILSNNQLVFPISEIEEQQLFPRPEEYSKVKVVREFISKSFINSILVNSNRAQFGFQTNKKIVTMLGGLSEIKGSYVFLRSISIVLQKYRDVVFVIAGKNYHSSQIDKNNYARCMKIIKSLEGTHSIYLLGEIRNPLDLIAVSDIIVSPSSSTHFSRPTIEAWGFGKPVVASDTLHSQNLITHEKNGLLFESGNDIALANSLIRLLSDPILCERLGEEGKRKAFVEYDSENNLHEIFQRCDDLVNNWSMPKII